MPIYVNELEYWSALGFADRAQQTIRRGLDVNHASSGGYAPLHAAAENGHMGVIEALLRAGANPKAATDDGETPSDLARKAGHAHVVERLMRAEAETN
jgi:uncharacterized protein